MAFRSFWKRKAFKLKATASKSAQNHHKLKKKTNNFELAPHPRHPGAQRSLQAMDLNFRQEASAEFWIVFWENARKHIRNKNAANIHLYVNCKSCARATRVAAIFMTSTNVIAKISSSKSIKLPVVFQWDLLHCSQLKTSQVLCHRNDRGKANTPNLD